MRVYTGGVVVEGRRKPDTAAMPTTTTMATVEEVGRLPSIEMEPKTLTLDQIKYAREAALYVVSTKSEEEAVRIFTSGLKPVVQKSSSVDSSDDDVDLDGCCFDDGGAGSKTRGRRPSSMDEDARDVATAPF